MLPPLDVLLGLLYAMALAQYWLDHLRELPALWRQAGKPVARPALDRLRFTWGQDEVFLTFDQARRLVHDVPGDRYQ